MQDQSNAPPAKLRPDRSGLLVLQGWGLRVNVNRSRLVVCDGLGPRRREGELLRASSGLKRLVIIGRAGSLSLAAIGWLRDIGAELAVLDYDGEVLVCSGWRGSNDARLRRAQ